MKTWCDCDFVRLGEDKLKCGKSWLDPGAVNVGVTVSWMQVCEKNTESFANVVFSSYLFLLLFSFVLDSLLLPSYMSTLFLCSVFSNLINASSVLHVSLSVFVLYIIQLSLILLLLHYTYLTSVVTIDMQHVQFDAYMLLRCITNTLSSSPAFLLKSKNWRTAVKGEKKKADVVLTTVTSC